MTPTEQTTLETRDVDVPNWGVLHVNEINPDSACNPRHEREEMAGLTASVSRRGQLQNINVVERAEPDDEGRRYDLAAGRSRYAAIRSLYDSGAGSGQILVIIHPIGADIRGIALTENLQRVQLKPGELAQAVLEYADELGRPETEIAELLDCSEHTVRDYLRLARALPDNAIAKLNTGALTKTAAEKLLPLAARAPDLVEGVIAQAGEGIAASEIAANPDFVIYEAVRDRRIQGTYAEPFTGGLDVLDVRDVLTRAQAALRAGDPKMHSAAPTEEAEQLASQLAGRDVGERLAHVEPSDVHRVAQTAPDGAIVDLTTKKDPDDGEVLSRAVVCTSPALMLEWGITAAKRLLRTANVEGEDEEPTNLMEMTADALAAIKVEAQTWNHVLTEFCLAISAGTDGCDRGDTVDQLLLGACHLPGRLLVGQGLGHVRGDWRTDNVAVNGGRIEERERPPIGADDAQRRFEEELDALDVDAAVRFTAAAVVAGALCDTREVGGRQRNRQLALPSVDKSTTGRMALAIAALADAWEQAPAEFSDDVKQRLGIDDAQTISVVDTSKLKRRSRA